MKEHGAQLQTQPPVRRQQRMAGDLWTHLAIAQDEVRQDREHRATRGALETPDGEMPQPDTDIMGVARQAPAPATGRLVPQLKAQGEDDSDHQFDKGLAVAQQLKVGRFVLKIDGDSPVFAGLVGCAVHGSPSGQMVGAADDPRWTHAFTISREWGRCRGFTTKSGGMWKFHKPLEFPS